MDKTQNTTCGITSLSLDVIKYMVGFLNHDDARSLNQTCKSLRKDVPHKCLPPSIQVINVGDLDKLKNKEPILSEGLILYEMPLDSELLNLIRDCCPKLKYLFIKYSCRRNALTLNFENLPCVGISIKINMLCRGCSLSISNLSSTVESFTMHIFKIDPVTFKTIKTVNQSPICLVINNLENLKSL
jgi:hypothetical protein